MDKLLGKVQDNSQKIDGKIKLAKWMLKKYWYLHVLTLIVGICMAKYINYKIVPMYTSRGSFLIYDKDAGHNGTSTLSSFTSALNKSTSISDEIAILTSPNLFLRLVDKLNLHIKMYEIQKYKNVELYGNRPFTVFNYFDTSADSRVYSIEMKIIDKDHVEIIKNKKSSAYKVNTKIPISNSLTIIVKKSNDFEKFIGKTISYSECEKYDAAVNYAGALNVQRLDKSSNVITVTQKDPCPKRAFDIVNGVTNEYIAIDVENKRASADTAYQYVAERLDTFAEELNKSEVAIATYRNQHGLISPSTQSGMVLAEKGDIEKEQRTREIQVMLINDYKSFISEHLYSIAPFATPAC